MNHISLERIYQKDVTKPHLGDQHWKWVGIASRFLQIHLWGKKQSHRRNISPEPRHSHPFLDVIVT